MKTIPLLLIAAALAASPAAAERWKQMPGTPNASLAIDLDSIKREGPWRVFRTRTTVPGLKGTIIGVVAMDCKAGITELRSQRGYDGTVLKRERVFPAGKRPRQKLGNPAADPAFKIVCTA